MRRRKTHPRNMVFGYMRAQTALKVRNGEAATPTQSSSPTSQVPAASVTDDTSVTFSMHVPTTRSDASASLAATTWFDRMPETRNQAAPYRAPSSFCAAVSKCSLSPRWPSPCAVTSVHEVSCFGNPAIPALTISANANRLSLRSRKLPSSPAKIGVVGAPSSSRRCANASAVSRMCDSACPTSPQSDSPWCHKIPASTAPSPACSSASCVRRLASLKRSPPLAAQRDMGEPPHAQGTNIICCDGRARSSTRAKERPGPTPAFSGLSECSGLAAVSQTSERCENDLMRTSPGGVVTGSAPRPAMLDWPARQKTSR
mmetsp:Transcript_14968/g.32499  ORF Transcript_14968/g.32499 Transcript_14968/m.32499 type:complete len:315 (-) Transcript_14968:34-978(-)